MNGKLILLFFLFFTLCPRFELRQRDEGRLRYVGHKIVYVGHNANYVGHRIYYVRHHSLLVNCHESYAIDR